MNGRSKRIIMSLLAIPMAIGGAALTWADPATWTLDQLRDAAEQRLSRIGSLAVSYRFDRVAGSGRNTIARAHWEVVIEGENFLSKRTYGLDPDVDPTTFERWVSFNGTQFCGYNSADGQRRMAGISESHDGGNEIGTKNVEYFWFAMLHASEGGNGASDGSLVSLLNQDDVRVREETEAVGGVECHVVDLFNGRADRPILTVWLDAAHGVTPMRQRYFAAPAFESVLVEYETTNLAEVDDGLWLPLEGLKRVYPMLPDLPELPDPHESYLEVDTAVDGERSIVVNRDFDDAIFRMWEQVPAGTMVFIEETQESWIAKADHLQEQADIFLASLPALAFEEPSVWVRGSDDRSSAVRFGASLQASLASSWGWLATMGISAGFAGVILFRWMRGAR